MSLIDKNNKSLSPELQALKERESKLTIKLNDAKSNYDQLLHISDVRDRDCVTNARMAEQTQEAFDLLHPIVVTTELLKEARKEHSEARRELTKVQQQIAELTFSTLLNQKPRSKLPPSSTSELINIIDAENVDLKRPL